METNGGEGYVKMEVEMGVIHLQAKESPRWLAITRIKAWNMSLSLQKEPTLTKL